MEIPNDIRVRELLSEAMSRPAEQRRAFLDEACGSDAAVRAKVQGLLAGLERAGAFLSDATVDQPDRGSVTTLDAAPLSEAPGARIGRYKLLQLIGEGGFGSVFMAEQEQPVRRRVAIKIIKLGMDTKQVIARFEAERQALAMMDHTHIARVLDAGATETGRPYFVMELVRGVPITEYCDSQNLSTRERLALFIPVCNAVQHAHQKGIIHRDIKPSNVMVTLADGKPVPKIIDFGIAKATNARLTEQTYFTEYRQFIGTPQYMSPEQAEMTGIDIDTRSDIYSLGVLLYELLTGTTPLDAKDLRSQAYEQIRRTIREVEPPAPSTRLSGLGDTAATIAQHRKTEPRKLGQLLRGELDWIVMRALEKDRTRRYDTPGDMASDIQRHLDNEPVRARPPSTVYAMRKFVSKHRIGMLAGTAVLTALLAGLALATAGFIRAKSERDTAERARVEAQAQKKIAEDQKQLAVDNAKRADENAKETELSLADGLILQADALSVANRFVEAHRRYTQAYDKFAELKAPLTAAKAGLWSSYHQMAFPLMSFSEPTSPISAGSAGTLLQRTRAGPSPSVVIAPDGRTALTASFAKTLKLWDIASGKEMRTLSGHAEYVSCVAFAGGSEIALSGSWDKTLKLWDLANGKELRTLTGHTAQVTSVAVAPDGRTALSGCWDGTLKLWDLDSGKVLRTLTGHADSAVTCVAMAPDGRTALSGSDDHTLKLWDLGTGKELHTLAGHTETVSSVAFAPDGKTALSGSFDKTVKLWGLADGKLLRTFTGHTNRVTSVAIAPDGRTAFSGSADNTLKLWGLVTGKEMRTIAGTEVAIVALAPDGRTALSRGSDETLKLWDLSNARELRSLTGHNGNVMSVAIAPDSRTALSASNDSTLKLWDTASGKVLHTFNGHAFIVTSVAFAPDGRTAISGSYDRTLKLWDLTSGRELRTFKEHSAGVTSVAIAPNGRTALSGSYDSTLKLWDLATGAVLHTFAGQAGVIPAGAVNCVAISRDDRTGLSGGEDGAMKLWDLDTGKLVRTFTGHTDAVTSVAFAPDGKTAVSGSLDKTMKLWDLGSGKLLRTFIGHTWRVTAVAIAPDGRTALSGSEDGTLKLWELTSGNELRTFDGHSGNVSSVAISPDGRFVLSGSANPALMLWDFGYGTTHRAFEPRVAAAQARLQQAPSDPDALATLGEWYAFHGMDQWAVDFLGRARESGAAVAPLTMARCYWALDRNAQARREFQIALEQSRDPAEQTYLGWCIQRIDSDLATSKDPRVNK